MKIKMKNPPLDQTEGQREGDQAKKLSQPMKQLIRRAGQQVLLEAQDERQWHPLSSPTPDREWHLTKIVFDLPPQPWITNLAQAIDYLTQELLTGHTYDLMKGSCKSVAELEYHLEEVFKATNDQLDWNNPEGTPYPHDLSKPLPLILNARGRPVIPFDHFINNDLEYLKGGSLSHKYTTSITKTKAADYGQIKWIEDRIPRNSMDMLPTWKLQRMYTQSTGSSQSSVSRS
ncbi:hypothetical protein Tco_0628476 [Tanacetum coccineum]|uniref:Uncharacterized protein n=1 Tax=Tanacetum coccineum TaxID=301880 RepID=A0ABQ4WQF4_9ASTR